MLREFLKKPFVHSAIANPLSCKHCVYFMPNTDKYGFKKRTFFEWLGQQPKTPTVDACRYGMCAVHMQYASAARAYDCAGKDWRDAH